MLAAAALLGGQTGGADGRARTRDTAAVQAEGWQLEQPEPGVLRWRVPSGRTYTTSPTAYAI
jgi:hypothetical protein